MKDAEDEAFDELARRQGTWGGGFKAKQAMAADKHNRKRGSIALARSLCFEINGAADDSDDMDGNGYGSVDVAEILSAEIVRLREALEQPAQKPVAHVYLFDHEGRPRIAWDNAKDIKIGDKLYTAPPQLE